MARDASQPPPPSGFGRRLSPWLIGVLMLVLGVLALLWVIDLFRDDEAVADIGISLEDVASEPQQYEGERVIVSGVVGEQLGDRLFAFEEEGVVVLAEGAQAFEEETVAQVEGSVEVTDAEAVAAEVGAASEDLAEALGDGEVVLLRASSVILNPIEAGAAQTPAGTPAGATEAEQAALDDDDVLSVREAVERADSLEGREVTVAGQLSVGIAEHVASFDGLLYRTEDMLIVHEQLLGGVFPRRVTARATGTLVPFDVAAVEEQLGIDLEDDLADDYNGTPAILADSIHFFVDEPGIARVLPGLLGWTVTVTGEITAVHSPSLFTVGGDAGALVVIEGAGEEPLEGALARATGTALLLDPESPEGLPAPLAELPPDQLEEFEGMPVLVAEELQLTR